jgi:hypothetical protein
MVGHARLFLAWSLAATAALACARTQGETTQPEHNEVSMTNRQAPRIEVVGQLRAEGAVRLDVVDVDWSAGGAVLAVPDPRRMPVRPHLEPFPTAIEFLGTAVIGARAVRGDGEVSSAAVLVYQGFTVIPLPEPPLAVAPRRGGPSSYGAWVLYRDRLAHHHLDGSEGQRLKLTGVLLVAVESGVWLVGLDSAHYVDNAGTVQGPYPWSGGLASAPSGGSLCTLKGKPAGTVTCIDQTGKQTATSLPAPPKPLEQLLASGAHGFVTAQLSTVRWFGKGGATPEFNIQGAGVTPAGAGFVSTLDQGGLELYVAAVPPQRLPLPSGVTPQGPFGVARVVNGRTLAAGLDQAAWYRGDKVEGTFALDEDAFRHQVFPQAWRLAATRMIALTDGSLIVSASGRTGMALLKVTAP